MIEKEKVLERRLKLEVEKAGGKCLKLPAIHEAGIPDRLCLFPCGRCVFVEVKETGAKPSKKQLFILSRLNNMNHSAVVIDSTDKIKQLIQFINETRATTHIPKYNG